MEYVRRTGRKAKEGLNMFRRGTVKEVSAGVGGGFIASIIIGRIMQGRQYAGTAETVGGLAAAWATGGWKGLLGYGVVRFATTGFNIGGQQVGFANTVQGGGAPALGVRILGQ